MKKSFLLILILLLFINSFAQKKWHSSFVLGPNITKHRNIDIYNDEITNIRSNYGFGYTAGFDFYRIYDNNFFFKTGLRYKLKSGSGTLKFHFNQDTTFYKNYSYKNSYVSIPLMLGYHFNIKKQKFMISTGFEIDYLFYINEVWNNEHISQANSGIYNISPKFVISAFYLYPLNNKISLTISPEFAQSKMLDKYTDFGDYLIEWHLNFGIIWNLP